MKFEKYHALGNDYVVVDERECSSPLTPEIIRRICERNFGVGSDGLLLGTIDSAESFFALRIFNPDGGEAERSGNGLRIFARYLHDKGLVSTGRLTINTRAGAVPVTVENDAMVTVEMGRASFASQKISVAGPARDVINEEITAAGRTYLFTGVTVGNPHCVILRDEISPEETRAAGPEIESAPRFPNRTNVQFMKILGRGHIQIEIWERGAGYTLSSGSSACAAAAVARRLDRCNGSVEVVMPGGTLNVHVADDYSIRQRGSAEPVYSGELSQGFLNEKR